MAAFENSKITHVSGNGDKAFVVEFTLAGVEYVAMNGGPMYKLSEAVSIMVSTDDQAETHHLWN